MLDIKEIRSQCEKYQKLLAAKGSDINLTTLLSLDEDYRSLKTECESLKAKRNKISSEIGTYKREGKDPAPLFEEVAGLGKKIAQLEQESKDKQDTLHHQLACLPNLPFDDIPISDDIADNQCLKSFGEKPSFPFPFKNHLELNESLQLFDFETAAKVSGSGWPLYRGLGAQLEWALLQFMVQHHIKKGFTFILPPILTKGEALYGAGQLPKFDNQQFKITDEHYELYLNPTSEVLLNSLHYDSIISEEQLPEKYVAYTPCFRREAGAAGANERGLIRMHQFNKVEMFCFTRPEESASIFAEMQQSAEEILEALGLHYRSMLLVTGDMSFGAAKTVDIEVWLPGQDRYYEVSSVSNCTDFQSRRSQIRFKREGKMIHPHTLNGSGLATSRLMVALLENFQKEDGSVEIPEVLRPMMGGKSFIEPTS